MYEKLARELAVYAYRLSECRRLNLDDELTEYWTGKYYGFARCVLIVTGVFPITTRLNAYEIEVNIGDYQTVVTFDFQSARDADAAGWHEG